MRSLSKKASGCAYRGEHGFKCAVGASIPDSMYDPEIEGKTVSQLLQRAEFSRLFLAVSPLLLGSLQALHDGHFDDDGERISEDAFEAGMMWLASSYNLDYT